MNLVMMGTGDFAVPTFRRLLDRGRSVRLLVTQPDRPQGRHQQLIAAPIKQLALERAVEVFQPQSVNAPDAIARIAALEPDLLVVAAYGQILSRDLLRVPSRGGINLHASLLPKYRGAAPIQWAIYHGESITGVTVIQMNPVMDAGGVLLQADTRIEPNETAGDLEVRLAEIGAELVGRAIDGMAAGTLTPTKQQRALVSKAPKLRKEDGLIDWSRPAQAVCNQVRAMHPWPLAYTYYCRSGQSPERVIIEQAVVEADRMVRSHEPGSIDLANGNRLLVQCGDGWVRLDRIRPAGKRTMGPEEFLRGRRILPGDRFQ